jgi:hypothetical protein
MEHAEGEYHEFYDLLSAPCMVCRKNDTIKVTPVLNFLILARYFVRTLLPVIDIIDYSFKPFQTWVSLLCLYGMPSLFFYHDTAGAVDSYIAGIHSFYLFI